MVQKRLGTEAGSDGKRPKSNADEGDSHEPDLDHELINQALEVLMLSLYVTVLAVLCCAVLGYPAPHALCAADDLTRRCCRCGSYSEISAMRSRPAEKCFFQIFVSSHICGRSYEA